MSEFRIPPVSTLIGSSPVNFLRILRNGGRISSEYYLKIILSSLIIGSTAPFRLIDRFTWNKKAAGIGLSKPTLFILGHWRSGTTFLHNMLCQDPRAGYITTYQSLFPEQMASQWLFKPLMKMTMPDKRPSDNVKLDVDLPQEDEFALGNLTPESYYHFFYFPEQYKYYREKAIESINRNESDTWEDHYRMLLIKASMNTRSERLVIKNPVNTARIPTLLRLFPDAKFLFIYRNPVSTVLSTIKFFKAVMPTLWFHQVDDAFIESMVFDNFDYMLKNYEETKYAIPRGNLMEIRYENFESSPLENAHLVYSGLLRESMEPFADKLNIFLGSQKKHRVNSYEISSAKLNQIKTKLGYWMNQGGYTVPDEVVVKD